MTIIEVEPTIFGNPIKDEKLLMYQQAQIDADFANISQLLAGTLCAEHVHLPELEPSYTDRRWIIKVTCCCAFQMDQVENRLNEYYKK